jgi:hypothetical protein
MSKFVPGKPGGTARGRGRIQVGIRRAFIASAGRPLIARDFLPYAYPRQITPFENWQRFCVRRALDRDGYRVVGDRR